MRLTLNKLHTLPFPIEVSSNFETNCLSLVTMKEKEQSWFSSVCCHCYLLLSFNHLVLIWIATRLLCLCWWLHFLCGSRALFMGPASTDFNKFFFKIGLHGTIHTFKNYFVIMFSVFNNKWYPNRPLFYALIQLWIFYTYCNCHLLMMKKISFLLDG